MVPCCHVLFRRSPNTSSSSVFNNHSLKKLIDRPLETGGATTTTWLHGLPVSSHHDQGHPTTTSSHNLKPWAPASIVRHRSPTQCTAHPGRASGTARNHSLGTRLGGNPKEPGHAIESIQQQRCTTHSKPMPTRAATPAAATPLWSACTPGGACGTRHFRSTQRANRLRQEMSPGHQAHGCQHGAPLTPAGPAAQ